MGARSCLNGEWYLFDDSKVKQVSARKVASERVGAYVLFYIRRDHRPESWGPPGTLEDDSDDEPEKESQDSYDWAAPTPPARDGKSPVMDDEWLANNDIDSNV